MTANPTSPIPPRESSGDAAALEARLAERGLAFRVESLGGVAIVQAEVASPSLDAPTRRWIVQSARDAGFANVALEIPPSRPAPADASLPGGEPG